LTVSTVFAQDNRPLDRSPKREVRAAWITTVLGLDWPKSVDPVQQEQSLREMVQNLKRLHFNTIFFQVRGRADALYRSRYEPWSHILTGTLGKDPGWDPLQFIVREAHAEGMEVHVWFNTFLFKSGRDKPPVSDPLHAILQHPDWVHLVNGEWWADPGVPEVRSYLLEVAMDIVRRYDVDGIQFDFLRYPGASYPDETTYQRYGQGMPRGDWRRANINAFVRAFYDSAMAVKPMLKVGSAPIGIYRNSMRWKSWEAFGDLFQDSRSWLSHTVHDYLAPQVYWPITDKPGSPDFAALTREWVNNASGRHIYVGIGAYKDDVFQQLPQLIDFTRSNGTSGLAFFRYEHVTRPGALGDRFHFLANIPSMPWKDAIAPLSPQNLVVLNETDGIYRISWAAPPPAPDGDTAKYYNVYRSTEVPIAIDDPATLRFITPGPWTSVVDTILHPTAARYYYAVTSFDKGNNESTPTHEQGVIVPEIVQLAQRLKGSLRMGNAFARSSMFYVPYELDRQSLVWLTLHDEQNREVVRLVDAVQPPGRHVASADVSTLPKGMYTAQLVAGDRTIRRSVKVGK
jgi:uncharacterized lipoprotein YddW (UPF0748 family)